MPIGDVRSFPDHGLLTVELMRPTVLGALWDQASRAGLIARSPFFAEGTLRFFAPLGSEAVWVSKLQQLAYEGFLKTFRFDRQVAPVFIRGTGLSSDIATLHEVMETLAQSSILVTMGAVSETEIVFSVPQGRLEDAVRALLKAGSDMSSDGTGSDGKTCDAIVIGDGWSALGAAGFLGHAGKKVRWIAHTGSRMIAPLPTLEAGPGVSVWSDLARRLEVDPGEVRTGSFLREFRNKAFREPAWTKAPTPETRREVRDETLWEPERRIAGAFEARFGQPIAEVEERIRARVAALPGVERTEGVPVTEFRFEKADGSRSVTVALGSGETVTAPRAFYADRWSALPTIEGMPKPITFLRGRDPVGVLQAFLTHEAPVGAEVSEAFFGAITKEAGEEFQRHVWGHFFNEGRCSVWSLFLPHSEVEDNHEIAKRLRRMKQALDRMFSGTEWLPEGKAELTANVANETVRFEESVIFGAGEAPTAPVTLPRTPGMLFLTDGYGPAAAMHQVALALGEELGIRTELPSLTSSLADESSDAPGLASGSAAPREALSAE